jgi:hypothetical protein
MKRFTLSTSLAAATIFAAAGATKSVGQFWTPIAGQFWGPIDRQSAWANVKPMPGRVNVPSFSRHRYRFRSLVERFFNKLHISAPWRPARKARRQLPRPRQTRRPTNLDAVYESVT